MNTATFPQVDQSGRLTPEQQCRVRAAVRKESAAWFYLVGSLAAMIGVIVWLDAGAARTILSGPASSAQDPASFMFYLVCAGRLLLAVLGLVVLGAAGLATARSARWPHGARYWPCCPGAGRLSGACGRAQA